MELDPDDIFRDDEDDSEADFFQGNEPTKEFVVYLVDASPKMFSSTCPRDDGEQVSHFQVAFSCISQTLKSQIINKSYDEVGICFFNTREKTNLQGLNNVFVFNVAERECLDRPTARLIKDFDSLEGCARSWHCFGTSPFMQSKCRIQHVYFLCVGALLKKCSSTAHFLPCSVLTRRVVPFMLSKSLDPSRINSA